MTRLGAIVMRLGRYAATATVGALIGAALIGIYLTRSGPSLEIWHSHELDAEFTSGREDAIPTFEDYLGLEERLFAALDTDIYARVPTGPAYALARYSASSAADPRARQPNWNRSYEHPTAAAVGGVLLLHGTSDSPYSLRALGEAFAGRGYWVVGLRLPGHGTIPSALTRTRWEDMAAAVRLGVRHLRAEIGSAPLHIVGYSTGAPLAIDYVLEADDDEDAVAPESLVLISPALGVTPVAALARWRDRLSVLPGLDRLAWTSILPEFDPYKYNSFATNAADQVYRLTRSVATRIETRAATGPIGDFPPTLVFLSAVDATVTAGAVIDNLLEHLAPGRHELVLFDINRASINSTVLIDDPGPLTRRLMTNDALPFALTVITNERDDSSRVVSRRKSPHSATVTLEPLDLSWPAGVISLSHVALPFPPDDPLYGRRRSDDPDVLQLGQIAVQGELGVLRVPSDWLLRLRHNPFYEFLSERTFDWMTRVSGS